MTITFAKIAALSLTLSATDYSSGPESLYRVGNEAVGTPLVFVPPTINAPVSSGENTTEAESAGAEEESSAEDEGGADAISGPPTVTTQAIVKSLGQSTQYCRQMPQKEYVIDCLSERLDNVSRRLAKTSGNEEIQEALAQASRGLNQIARQNRSRSQPRASFASQGENAIRTSRPLVPVATNNLDSAISQALNVIDETETILLRSVGDPDADANRFQLVADAVGSNKVLLRSL